jgi:hypothetical protein
MIKNSINLIVLLLSCTCFSQVNFTNPDEANVISIQTKEIDLTELKTEGSPYLDENFKPGKVLVNGTVKMTGKLRYNAYNSEIELAKNKFEFTAILKRNYISAVIGGKKYKLYSYANTALGNVKIGYFNPLNNGEVQLLFKPEIKVRRGKTPSTSYDRTVAPRFIDISSYYIKKGDKPAEKIYLRKKYIYKVLGDNVTLKTYVKKNKLKLNNVNDIIKAFDYYNQELSGQAK